MNAEIHPMIKVLCRFFQLNTSNGYKVSTTITKTAKKYLNPDDM